jgi:hypothetical protein
MNLLRNLHKQELGKVRYNLNSAVMSKVLALLLVGTIID